MGTPLYLFSFLDMWVYFSTNTWNLRSAEKVSHYFIQ